jgi:cytochrome c oxidase assembly factor CtaG
VSFWQTPWSLDVLAAALLVLAAGISARGWMRLRRRVPARCRPFHLLAFLLGLDVLLVAMAPPLEALAARSLTAHMTQHLLLMMVAPLLLWLGAPVAPILLGIPAPVRRAVIALSARAPARRLGRALTHPAVGWVAFAVVAWAWHAPALYELALRSPGWHHVEHACFLGSALLFWWPVVQPWPSRPRWPRWSMIPYLGLAEVQNILLAAVFTLSGRVLYPTYAATAAGAGTAALDDQIVAWVIMWGPGSLMFLLPAGWLIVRLLTPARMMPAIPPPANRATPRRGSIMGRDVMALTPGSRRRG